VATLSFLEFFRVLCQVLDYIFVLPSMPITFAGHFTWKWVDQSPKGDANLNKFALFGDFQSQ